jgi:hypothetical protein
MHSCHTNPRGHDDRQDQPRRRRSRVRVTPLRVLWYAHRLTTAAAHALVRYDPAPVVPELHWQLLPYEPARGKPRLHFDVSQSPERIRVTDARGGMPRPLRADERARPAASTPLAEMVIRCAPLPLPAWDVRVRRPDGGPLRAADVFAAVHAALRAPLAPRDRAQWPPAYLAACAPHFRARCAAAPALAAREEAVGLRRVDLLRGRTAFRGLSCPAPGKAYWIMHLDKPDAPR